MPFTNGFDFLDLNTYGWMEYTILGVGLLVLILLLVVWPICASKKKKKVKTPRRLPLGNPTKLVYNSLDKESLLFDGEKMWYVRATGQTELMNLVSGNANSLQGKLVYASKEVKRTEVVQEGALISRNSSIVREYTTVHFLSNHEVAVGDKHFITEELKERRAQEALDASNKEARLQVIKEAEEAKQQAAREKTAKKQAKKAAKKQLKEEKAETKKQEKLEAKKVKKDQKVSEDKKNKKEKTPKEKKSKDISAKDDEASKVENPEEKPTEDK